MGKLLDLIFSLFLSFSIWGRIFVSILLGLLTFFFLLQIGEEQNSAEISFEEQAETSGGSMLVEFYDDKEIVFDAYEFQEGDILPIEDLLEMSNRHSLTITLRKDGQIIGSIFFSGKE